MNETTQSPRPTLRHALSFLSVAALVIVADQLTKLAVVTFIAEGDTVPRNFFLQLTNITNTGSAFGLLQGQTSFLILASIIGVIAVMAYYRSHGATNLLLRMALGLVLGGAIGNLLDRVFRGQVVDFIYVQLWTNYHWPAFNVADSSLLIGLGLLALFVLGQKKSIEPPSQTPSQPMAASEPSVSEPSVPKS